MYFCHFTSFKDLRTSSITAYTLVYLLTSRRLSPRLWYFSSDGVAIVEPWIRTPPLLGWTVFLVCLEHSIVIEVVHGSQPVEDTEQDQIQPLVNNPAIISSCNCSCCIVVDAFCNTVCGKYRHRLGGIISYGFKRDSSVWAFPVKYVGQRLARDVGTETKLERKGKVTRRFWMS